MGTYAKKIYITPSIQKLIIYFLGLLKNIKKNQVLPRFWINQQVTPI
jgi:hypothetical protein